MTSSRRTFVLDTSVLLSEPQALRQFEEHAVVLPLVVLTELEAKRNHPELGWAARTALRSLEELRERHASLLEELPVNEHGGTIRVELNHTSTEPLPEALRSEANDHRILTVAHNLAREGLDVTLVTKDLPLRLKAGVVGLDAAEYRDTEVADGSWTGFTDLAVESAVVDEFYDEGVVDRTRLGISRSTPASRWSPARSRASAACERTSRSIASPTGPCSTSGPALESNTSPSICSPMTRSASCRSVAVPAPARACLRSLPRSRPSSRTAPTRR